MQPYSIEKSISEGEFEVRDLFQFVQKNAENFDAYQMEKDIFSKLKKIGLAAMKGYFAVKGTGDIGATLESRDGTVMKKESQLRGQKYSSVFGEFIVPRTYYHTKGQAGIIPLDAEANLPERCYSYLLQEWMNLCSIRDSFEQSNVTLDSFLGIDISQSRFEVVSRASTNSYNEFYENKELPDPKSEGEIQVVEFDGKGVPMIKSEAAKIKSRLGKGEKRQKKKEATVGVSFTVDRNIRIPKDVAENLIYPKEAKTRREKQRKSGGRAPPPPRAQNIRRIASLERPREDIMDEIVDDAKRRNPDNTRPLGVVMDGALCLWKAVSLALSGLDWVGILDIIHVVEYLWTVGNALHGENRPAAKKWVYDHLLAILQGRVGRVIGGLKQVLKKRENQLTAGQQKTIRGVIKYFENHKRWMHYDEYLKEGYPIGSGIVESTCGHTVKNRMEGAGRRWSIEGAEPMLLLRSVYTSNDWEEYWRTHRWIECKKLYGNVFDALEYSDDFYEQKVA